MIFALTLMARAHRARVARKRLAAARSAQARAWDELARRLQNQADAAWEAAMRRPPESAERTRLECVSHRFGCEALAAEAEAGGDTTTAQMHRDAAAWWQVQERRYPVGGAWPQEAAHA